jgi:hypothetical protein
MKNLTFLLAGLVAFSGVQARAEDGIKGSFGLLAPQGDASTLTRQHWGGYTYELGFQYTPPDYGFSISPYVGWGRLPGKKNLPDRNLDSLWGPNTYDLTNWHVGMDINLRISPALPLYVAFGPQLVSWQLDRVGVSEASLGNTQIKLGYRVGLEYAFSRDWSACVYFTQSEWRGIRDVSELKGYVDDSTTPSYIDGLNPCRPAYFSIMARYSF